MISVKYSVDKPRRLLRITVKGHAGMAPAGHDVICSAVTILVRTLARVVCDMHEIHMLARPPTIDTKLGLAEVSCRLIDDIAYQTAKTRFDTIYSGMRLLCENFPQYVQIK